MPAVALTIIPACVFKLAVGTCAHCLYTLFLRVSVSCIMYIHILFAIGCIWKPFLHENQGLKWIYNRARVNMGC